MDRKDFLNLLGISAGATALLSCAGCSKNSNTVISDPAPVNVNFLIDLTDPAYINLNSNGGYVSVNNVIVAKTLTGNFIAVQQSCSHQAYPLSYQAANHNFYCSNHFAAFSETGAVLNGPATAPLKVYNVQFTGVTLKIYS